MNIKFKNNIEDIEKLLEYNYLKSFWWKKYYMFLSVIAILTPSIVIIYTIRSDPKFYLNIFILSFYALIIIALTLFIIYLFLKILPKLMMKRLKNIAHKYYKKKQLFSAEKIILLKDEYIEVKYNEKNLNINLDKNIFVDQFKGYIIISSVFMKNKIKKVYPLVIPITIFESEQDKEIFITNIENKK
ncbi:hypothetical protein NSB31_29715 [Bacillus cereus]|uniref:hypothetical protein n=1 Tax=Bacillota TaxID=1239 RepID=UPI001896E800|nr:MULTISPECIES: hypothetical protein [Bacillota]MCR1950650.1 hypothetical protein [Clostridium sp. DSM 100503]MCR2013832.1 hypothetical protein [Bacillus cereus]